MTGAVMLKAAGLWAKTSAKGNRYLVGRLGGVKLLILANHDRAGEADPTHVLYFAEAPDKPRAAPQDARTAPGDGLAPGTRRTRQRPRPRPSNGAGDGQPFDDEIPL